MIKYGLHFTVKPPFPLNNFVKNLRSIIIIIICADFVQKNPRISKDLNATGELLPFFPPS